MEKLLVIDPGEQSRVPFLRGILTRSLQDAGLSFEDSYRVASAVRDELREAGEVTTTRLREQVLSHLEPFGEHVRRRYRNPLPATPTILVQHGDGHSTPFSRGQNRVGLEACGFSTDESARIASMVYDRLVRSGASEIDVAELRRLNHEYICKDQGPDAGSRYLVWQEFHHSGRPLLVLIGGTIGSGKSTIASQVAHLLEIVRTQSTDMLREVMRMMVPQRLMPVLHTSSFKAWEELPIEDRAGRDFGALVTDGYLTQTEIVSVACEAVIQRALQERLSLILEGVHVHPSLLKRIPADAEAIVAPVMLGVLKGTELRQRIKGRGSKIPHRRAKRYLENFDAIWRIQSSLLSEADRTGVPIVANDDKEKAVHQVMGCIHETLAREFPGRSDGVPG